MATIRIDHQLLVELGLGHLDQREQDVIMRRITEVLELRAGFAVANSLTAAQQGTFERLLNSGRDEEAERYLERTLPDYAVAVSGELDHIATVIARSLRHGAVVHPAARLEEADA